LLLVFDSWAGSLFDLRSSAKISGKLVFVPFRHTLACMSRKPAPIKIINLEDGMPKVEQARLRMQHELHLARRQGYFAVKLIHGYGSSGVGGALRTELQKELRRLADAGQIRAFMAGEDWRISEEAAWTLLKRYPEWKQDTDLGKGNKGISIVLL
jgi:hypothetical protein